jgi:hypothetical protein
VISVIVRQAQDERTLLMAITSTSLVLSLLKHAGAAQAEEALA